LSIIEHEKLAVTQRHTAKRESSNTSADVESNGGGGGANGGSGGGGGSSSVGGGSIGSGSVSGPIGNGGGGSGVCDMSDISEAGETTMVRNLIKRTLTPAPSPASEYAVSNVYSTSHYYESPPKQLMR